MPDDETPAELTSLIRTAIADPGKFVPRNKLHEDWDGTAAMEQMTGWQARAVSSALTTAGLVVSVVEWGIRFGGPGSDVQRYSDEADARQAKTEVDALTGRESVVMTQQRWTGPWVPAGEGNASA